MGIQFISKVGEIADTIPFPLVCLVILVSVFGIKYPGLISSDKYIRISGGVINDPT